MRVWFALLVFCGLGAPLASAGIPGRYELDNAKLRAQVKKRWETTILRKAPKKYQAQLRQRMKQILDSLKEMTTTIWLKPKGAFRGVATLPLRKKTTRSKGTWAQKGSIVVIHTVDLDTKKKSKMMCKSHKDRLACHTPRSPLVMHFRKAKRPAKRPAKR